MTAVGHRPTLDEIIKILDACEVSSATDLGAGAWGFNIKFDPRKLSVDVEGWSDGLPKPTWLFEEIQEHLACWKKQCIREQQWVSKESQLHASIDSLLAHWGAELNRVSPRNGLSDRLRMMTISNTINRLIELKERREAGGVYSSVNERREKARKSWMEDETEAPKREEEQRRQREYTDFTYQQAHADWAQAGDYVREDAAKMWKEFTQQYESRFNQAFEDMLYWRRSNQRQWKPQTKTPGKPQWYEVLGVTVDATTSQIQTAYRRLASKYHPDRYKGADAHERMAAINEARDTGLAGL